jgi:SAM-dependent methyltransferase
MPEPETYSTHISARPGKIDVGRIETRLGVDFGCGQCRQTKRPWIEDRYMIGTLTKQLVRGVGRFVWYHITRIFHREQGTESAVSVAPELATRARIDALNDQVRLDPKYERLVQWRSYRVNVPPQEILADALYRSWITMPGGHKWTHYFATYQEVFGPRRTEPLRVLEIGVLGGASLRLWKQYFTHPGTLIVGIDIQPECIKFDAPANGIRVRIGDQTDAGFLKGVVEEFGPFDLIIDDGSHHSSHIIASFNHLFADGLTVSGIYFVEDLHANYWHPWRDSKRSFLDMCKELLDHMHAHYQRAAPQAFLINKPSDQPMAALEVPLITTMIKEIRFFDSIVAIHKTHREYIPYYLRA